MIQSASTTSSPLPGPLAVLAIALWTMRPIFACSCFGSESELFQKSTPLTSP